MFLGGNKFVNAYVERDKKKLKLAVFGVQVAAFLIEFLIADYAGLHRFYLEIYQREYVC